MAIEITQKGLYVEYTTIGIKERYSLKNIFEHFAVSMKGVVSIAVEGGVNDVFTFNEKLGGLNGGDFVSNSSRDGQITSRAFTGPNENFFLNISAIPSGLIKMGITIENI